MKLYEAINIASSVAKLNDNRKKDKEKIKQEDKKTLEFCNTIEMDFNNNKNRSYKEIYQLFYEKYINNINKFPTFIQDDFIDLNKY